MKNIFNPRTNILPYEYPELLKFKDAIRKNGTINGCNRCGWLKPRGN